MVRATKLQTPNTSTQLKPITKSFHLQLLPSSTCKHTQATTPKPPSPSGCLFLLYPFTNFYITNLLPSRSLRQQHHPSSLVTITGKPSTGTAPLFPSTTTSLIASFLRTRTTIDLHQTNQHQPYRPRQCLLPRRIRLPPRERRPPSLVVISRSLPKHSLASKSSPRYVLTHSFILLPSHDIHCTH